MNCCNTFTPLSRIKGALSEIKKGLMGQWGLIDLVIESLVLTWKLYPYCTKFVSFILTINCEQYCNFSTRESLTAKIYQVWQKMKFIYLFLTLITNMRNQCDVRSWMQLKWFKKVIIIQLPCAVKFQLIKGAPCFTCPSLLNIYKCLLNIYKCVYIHTFLFMAYTAKANYCVYLI